MVYGNLIRKLNLGNARICGVQKICFITLIKDVKIKINSHKFTYCLEGCETCCLLQGKCTKKGREREAEESTWAQLGRGNRKVQDNEQ